MTGAVEQVDAARVKQVVEGALMVADGPLSVGRLCKLFQRDELDPAQGRQLVREALRELGDEAVGRGYELKRVASGFRFQVRGELSPWIGRLWEEKPPRYSRALLETLALIAYKQPVTRGDIEKVRGVGVSQSILRTLLERGWVRVVGQRETPGRPNLYATTPAFLDYFNLRGLEELPPLNQVRALAEAAAPEAQAVSVAADGAAEHPTPSSPQQLGEVSAPVAGGEPPTGADVPDAAGERVPDGFDPVPAAEKIAAGQQPEDTSEQPRIPERPLAKVVRLPATRGRPGPVRGDS